MAGKKRFKDIHTILDINKLKYGPKIWRKNK